jgi:hypothetical protein
MKRHVGLVLSLSLVSGCEWFGGNDPCVIPLGADEAAFPAPQVRNPWTGRCEDQNPGGPGNPCDDQPQPTPLTEGSPGSGAPDPAWQDWAVCDDFCETLDEATCMNADGCRAAYMDSCPPGADCELAPLEFIGCWGVAPSGPIRGGDCSILDAYSCSLHDDCSPVHTIRDDGSYGDFTYCIAEPLPCGVPEPTPERRDPYSGECVSVGGCGGFEAPIQELDWALCDSGCEVLGEDECRAADGCRAAYLDLCPQCDALLLEFWGCWGVAPSGPIRGGECGPLDAYECSRHDDCVAVHLTDPETLCDAPVGCDIGPFEFCMNESTPPPPPPVCGNIADEVACISADTCQPLYEGNDCTCDAAGNCTCASWTFVGCTDP